MLPGAKRGPHTNGPSPPNGRSTPLIGKLADEDLSWVAVAPALGGGRHLTARAPGPGRASDPRGPFPACSLAVPRAAEAVTGEGAAELRSPSNAGLLPEWS